MPGRNPRSTVGTVTEIHDYLRLLWARVGIPHCPVCGREIRKQSVDEIVDTVCAAPEGTRMQILSPLVRGRKGEHRDLLNNARKSGFVRARVDGEMYDLEDVPELDKKKKHTIELVVDRLIRRENDEFRHRLAEDIEVAANRGAGLVIVDCMDRGETLYSMNYACPDCGVSIEELTPRMFSFNSPSDQPGSDLPGRARDAAGRRDEPDGLQRERGERHRGAVLRRDGEKVRVHAGHAGGGHRRGRNERSAVRHGR